MSLDFFVVPIEFSKYSAKNQLEKYRCKYNVYFIFKYTVQHHNFQRILS